MAALLLVLLLIVALFIIGFAVVKFLIWIAIILAVFVPLSVRQFKRSAGR